MITVLPTRPSRKQLKKEIEELRAALSEQKELNELLKNGKDYLRTELKAAHSRVYKLETELNDLHKTRYNPIVGDITALLDTLWRCRTHDGNTHDFICGVMEAYATCVDSLTKHHIIIYSSLYKPFDPREHEAIGIEITNEFPDNTVVQELTRGIAINGKVFRYAQVIVSKRETQL